jgi:hypothetical protein
VLGEIESEKKKKEIWRVSGIYFILFFSGTTAQRGPGLPHSLRFVDHTQ